MRDQFNGCSRRRCRPGGYSHRKKRFTLIAGPCQMESREHAFMMAGKLAELCRSLRVGLVYKSSFDKANRTSLSGKRGIGLGKTMEIFVGLENEYGLPMLTDIHTEEQCAVVAATVDILQIPAFLPRQTDLLVGGCQDETCDQREKEAIPRPLGHEERACQINHEWQPQRASV